MISSDFNRLNAQKKGRPKAAKSREETPRKGDGANAAEKEIRCAPQQKQAPDAGIRDQCSFITIADFS